jgi:hypothetical protein
VIDCINLPKGKAKAIPPVLQSLHDCLLDYHDFFWPELNHYLSENKKEVSRFMSHEAETINEENFKFPQSTKLKFLAAHLFYLMGRLALMLNKKEDALGYFKVTGPPSSSFLPSPLFVCLLPRLRL